MMSLSHLVKLSDTDEQNLAKAVVYHRNNNTIIICIKHSYEVDLDRIETPLQLLGWVEHLAAKTWMTTKVLRRFVVIVAKIKNWQIYGL
jgi:hypothetical protein